MVTRNSKYYKKKGATKSEVLRCPLCGKVSEIRNFSQVHRYGIYCYTFGGVGKISFGAVEKSTEFMTALNESIASRLIEILYQLTGKRYVPKELELSQYPTIKPSYIPPIKPRLRIFLPSIKISVKPKELKLNGKNYKNKND
jgi:hypothetical protein